MSDVEVVVSHHERAVVRVDDIFLKIDGDSTRTDVEIEAMELAPVPTPRVLWRRPPVLALAALPGVPLGRLGEPSTASSAAWAAAGEAVRLLHETALPPWPGWDTDEFTTYIDRQCEWLLTNDVVAPDVVAANRKVADAALRPYEPVFTHGDCQAAHVFVDGDRVVGFIDWADACRGDALFDLAVLTVGHGEHLDDVVRGYGTDVDRDVIRGWWALRRLAAVRWMTEHGFDPTGDIAVLHMLET